jgi:hypothetical protein
MASHQRKFYHDDNGQSWWLCRHEYSDVFVLVESNLPGDHSKFQVADFLGTEHSKPAQQALLNLFGSLASASLD